MLYKHLADTCFDDRLGAHGLDRPQVNALLAKLKPAVAKLVSRANKAAAPILDIASRTDDLGTIEKLAASIRKKFETVVVVGSGGSSLGGRTLIEFQAAPSPVTFHFLDNIDPETTGHLLKTIDVTTSCFLIISKSGTTVETLAQFYVLLGHAAKKLSKKKLAAHFILITMPGKNPLREAAKEYGFTVLNHETDIGGRFSILTNVGLLPAAIAGVDIRALRKGAQSVAKKPDDAALGAALQFGFSQQGRTISVMLPYGERLGFFAAWYRQLWAESLGKNGKGTTPIRAMGSSDQHSQLQLYLDGPKDKLFHLITLKRSGSGAKINPPAGEVFAYIRGKTLGDIMEAQQKATLETLVAKGCPVRVFALEKLSEKELGALLMHFMLEVILMAALLGVDPFDQPAVEDGKVLARRYLLKGKS